MIHNALRLAFATAGLFVVALPASAQWGLLGDQRALLGKTIVDVGGVSATYKQELPPVQVGSRELPPLPRRIRYVEFKGERDVLCFEDDLNVSLREEPAMILADSDGAPLLATFQSSIGSIDVKIRRARPIRCP